MDSVQNCRADWGQAYHLGAVDSRWIVYKTVGLTEERRIPWILWIVGG